MTITHQTQTQQEVTQHQGEITDIMAETTVEEVTTTTTTATIDTITMETTTDTATDTTNSGYKNNTSDSTERETQEIPKLQKEIENNKNNIKNQKQVSKNYKKQKNTNEMKIACLNVRGLNKKQKQNQIKKYIENEKWDVTILNETKIKENQGNFIFKGWENYDTINSSYNDENNKNGIIIVLKGNLSSRRINTEHINGHAIKIDLVFKTQKNIRIIGIYNPNANKNTTELIDNKLKTWIEEAKKWEHEIIVLGDFNESDKKPTKQKPLIKNLNNNGLIDIHKYIAGKDVLDTYL